MKYKNSLNKLRLNQFMIMINITIIEKNSFNNNSYRDN